MTAALESLHETSVRRGDVDGSPPPRSDAERSRQAFARVLFAAALLLGWFSLYFVFLSGFEQNHHQRRLYGELRTQLAKAAGPVGGTVAAGSPVGLLNIPGTNVADVVIVEDVGTEQLQAGPGHLRGTVFPGQAGVSVVMGRSMSFGAPFAHIAEFRRGQSIQVITGQGRFQFAVTGVRRTGDPLPPPLKQDAARLTLVTAAGDGRLSALTPSSTVYVDARLTSKVAAPGDVAAFDPKTTTMSGHLDTATLAQIALSLQFLVVALVAVVWGWRRWSRVGAWTAGAPVVLAALWLTSSLVSRLLPGLI